MESGYPPPHCIRANHEISSVRDTYKGQLSLLDIKVKKADQEIVSLKRLVDTKVRGRL